MREWRERGVMGALGACHSVADQGKACFGRREYGHPAVHWVMGACNQPPHGQPAHHTLYGSRIHRHEPPKMVLRYAPKLNGLPERRELGWSQADLGSRFDEDRSLALVRLAQQEPDMFLEQELGL